MALLYLEQEDAFWCLVTIVEVFMPRDYYTKTLLGSQVRLQTPHFSWHWGEFRLEEVLCMASATDP